MPSESVPAAGRRRAAGPREQPGKVGPAAARLVGLGEGGHETAGHLVELGLIHRRDRVAERGEARDIAAAQQHRPRGAGDRDAVDVDRVSADARRQRRRRAERDGAGRLVEQRDPAIGVDGHVVVGAADDRDADLVADLAEQRVALVERVADVLAGNRLAHDELVDVGELGEEVVELVHRRSDGAVRVVADRLDRVVTRWKGSRPATSPRSRSPGQGCGRSAGWPAPATR